MRVARYFCFVPVLPTSISTTLQLRFIAAQFHSAENVKLSRMKYFFKRLIGLYSRIRSKEWSVSNLCISEGFDVLHLSKYYLGSSIWSSSQLCVCGSWSHSGLSSYLKNIKYIYIYLSSLASWSSSSYGLVGATSSTEVLGANSWEKRGGDSPDQTLISFCHCGQQIFK